MERTLISWNLPNLITIPLMSAIGFLVVAAAWQLIGRAVAARAPPAAASTSGGY
ncbi:MAG TPA: hypothetical protein VGG68_14355 [Caulobacteraceae bacterium]